MMKHVERLRRHFTVIAFAIAATAVIAAIAAASVVDSIQLVLAECDVFQPLQLL